MRTVRCIGRLCWGGVSAQEGVSARMTDRCKNITTLRTVITWIHSKFLTNWVYADHISYFTQISTSENILFQWQKHIKDV